MNWQRNVKRILRYLDQRREYQSSTRVYKNFLQQNSRPGYGLSKQQQKEVIDFFGNYGIPLPDTLGHEVFYHTNGEFSPMYVPRYLYRNLFLRKFNQGDTWINRMKGWRDKNKYDFLKIGRFVPTDGRVVRGMLLGDDYHPITKERLLRHLEGKTDEVVVKVSDSYGGMGVRFIRISELRQWIEAKMAESLKMGSSYSIQLPFKQHQDMQRLNVSSVNTIRLTTLRMRGQDPFIRTVGPFVRIGRKDSRLDNVAQGNLCVGIHSDGRLRESGFDKHLNTYDSHPDHGYSFDSFTIAQFKECVELCIEMHHYLYEMDMIAWDVVIDRDGTPHILEFNVEFLDSDYNQVCNGPLFGDETHHILKSVAAD